MLDDGPTILVVVVGVLDCEGLIGLKSCVNSSPDDCMKYIFPIHNVLTVFARVVGCFAAALVSERMGYAVEFGGFGFVEDASKERAAGVFCNVCLLEALGQAVVATDVDGKIAYWNPAAEQLFGWSKTEMLGQNIREAFKDVILEGAEEIGAQTKNGKAWTGEATIKRRNGEVIATILSKRPIMQNGKCCGAVGVFTDVSNLRWMQQVLQEAIQAVAELNEKLRVVDSLTRHDLRNKLSVVHASAYLLKKRFGGCKEAVGLVEDVDKVSRQMLQILDFQQYYVQVGAEELRDVNVEIYIKEAVELFSDLKGIRLVNSCQGLMLLADSLLRQLFYNLIDNTLKYGEKTTKITFRYEQRSGGLALIYEDDGVGIEQEMKSQIFTEGYGKGTGYGLYLIRRICEDYGWTIQETGIAGQGAQFTIKIPAGEVKGKKRYQVGR